MATASLLPNGEQQFIDGDGVPYAGGFVYFYIPNTSTPKNTWQDVGETILNTNPVILNADGRAVIYGSGQYRQVLTDSLGNTVWDQLTQDVYGLIVNGNNDFTGNNTFDGNSTFNGSATFTGTVSFPAGTAFTPIANASGTVDAIIATYSPGVTSLADKTILYFISTGRNTLSNPTFSPNGLTAHTLTARGGIALLQGDIGAAGFVAQIEYNAANTRWELLNPAAAGAILTGYSAAPGTVSPTDNVFQALEKLDGNIANGGLVIRTQQFTVSGTYTPNAHLIQAEVTLCGGGGGSGAGGPAPTNGGTGGTTNFGAIFSATGGVGGSAIIVASSAQGGVGGIATGGDENYSGQQGGPSLNTSILSPPPGSFAGSFSGTGGNTPFGIGLGGASQAFLGSPLNGISGIGFGAGAGGSISSVGDVGGGAGAGGASRKIITAATIGTSQTITIGAGGTAGNPGGGGGVNGTAGQPGVVIVTEYCSS